MKIPNTVYLLVVIVALLVGVRFGRLGTTRPVDSTTSPQAAQAHNTQPPNPVILRDNVIAYCGLGRDRYYICIYRPSQGDTVTRVISSSLVFPDETRLTCVLDGIEYDFMRPHLVPVASDKPVLFGSKPASTASLAGTAGSTISNAFGL